MSVMLGILSIKHNNAKQMYADSTKKDQNILRLRALHLSSADRKFIC